MKRSEAVRRLTYALSLVCEGSVSVNIRLCDLEEMIEANTRFRGKEGPTDVLSFPAEPGSRDDPGSPSILLGDLLVCVPVCAWQAKRARWTLAEEIEKMIVHGLVHLKGFDHERSEAAWRVMSTLERALSRALREEYGKPEWLQVGGK